MNIKYTQMLIGSNKEWPCESSLVDFLLRMPDLGFTIKYAKVIPPLYILNEFLCKGEGDYGMSGSFTWSPIKLNEREYRSLVDDLKKILGDDIIILDSGKRISLNKWMGVSLSFYSKNRKNIRANKA